ncbi:MAG: undecaprenyl-diphosphate phosphatase [Lachnospiraceae bacterium]
MDILFVLLLGFLQGVFGFLPVSLEGVQAVFGRLFSMGDTGLLYCVFFHIGTSILFFFYIKRDLLRMPGEILRVLATALWNLRELLKAKIHQETFEPQQVFETNHESFSAMASIALLTALPLTLLLRPLAVKGFGSPLYTGIGFLITVVIFLVGGKLKIRSRLPMNTKVWYGVVAGILLAAGSFPGISVIGVLFVFGTIIGFNRKTAQRFAGICYVLASFGALPVVLLSGDAGTPGMWQILPALLGLAATILSGVFFSNGALRRSKMAKARHMALVSGLLGIAAIVTGFIY